MNQALLYRLMAVKWLETAERVEHRALKRCYEKRAHAYQALAAAAQRRAAPPSAVEVPPPGTTRH
jgi:hypothetical protein